jgi:hypothetical protein
MIVMPMDHPSDIRDRADGEPSGTLRRRKPNALNAVIGSPREPLATQGANNFVEQGLLDENKVVALPLR